LLVTWNTLADTLFFTLTHVYSGSGAWPLSTTFLCSESLEFFLWNAKRITKKLWEEIIMPTFL
jgi:hypothetical protein